MLKPFSVLPALYLAVFAILAQSSLVSARPATVDGFRAWVHEFRATAENGGISRQTYDTITNSLTPDFGLPDLELTPGAAIQDEQPEFVKTPQQYLTEKTLGNLAAQGRKLAALHKATLADIEHTYGVSQAVLLGLWGRETAFGTYKLPHNALRTLATQAYIGRRRDEFQKQFIDALRMVQEGVRRPEDMTSSWAGAMGLVQFLPSDYFRHAVDQDGDGRRDIWASVPDALASVANNLRSLGWEAGVPWGLEVDVPADIDCSLANLEVRKPVAEWLGLGVRPIGGSALPARLARADASLLMPAGAYGPAFLTFNNFQVIREYNRSDLYALFVGHLGDRITGAAGFARPWKPVTQILSREVEDMQKRLISLQLYKDKIDGKAGGKTRSAVGGYQKLAKLALTCWPTIDLVNHIRKNAPIADPS